MRIFFILFSFFLVNNLLFAQDKVEFWHPYIELPDSNYFVTKVSIDSVGFYKTIDPAQDKHISIYGRRTRITCRLKKGHYPPKNYLQIVKPKYKNVINVSATHFQEGTYDLMAVLKQENSQLSYSENLVGRIWCEMIKKQGLTVLEYTLIDEVFSGRENLEQPKLAQKDVAGYFPHPFIDSPGKDYFVESFSRDSAGFYTIIHPSVCKPIVIYGRRTKMVYKLRDGLMPRNYLTTVKAPSKYANVAESCHYKDAICNLTTVMRKEDYHSKTVIKPSEKIWSSVKMNTGLTNLEYTIIDEIMPGTESLENLKSLGRAELYTIYFRTNKFKFESESEPTIQSIFDFLTCEKSIKITIEGSADTIGTEKYNLKLSQKRAEYIKQSLITKGIDSSRLLTKGIGEIINRKDSDIILPLSRRTVLFKN